MATQCSIKCFIDPISVSRITHLIFAKTMIYTIYMHISVVFCFTFRSIFPQPFLYLVTCFIPFNILPRLYHIGTYIFNAPLLSTRHNFLNISFERLQSFQICWNICWYTILFIFKVNIVRRRFRKSWVVWPISYMAVTTKWLIDCKFKFIKESDSNFVRIQCTVWDKEFMKQESIHKLTFSLT